MNICKLRILSIPLFPCMFLRNRYVSNENSLIYKHSGTSQCPSLPEESNPLKKPQDFQFQSPTTPHSPSRSLQEDDHPVKLPQDYLQPTPSLSTLPSPAQSPPADCDPQKPFKGHLDQLLSPPTLMVQLSRPWQLRTHALSHPWTKCCHPQHLALRLSFPWQFNKFPREGSVQGQGERCHHSQKELTFF